MQTDGNAALSGQQKQRNVPVGHASKVMCLLLWTMHCGFFQMEFTSPMDFDIEISNDNEIFSSQ